MRLTCSRRDGKPRTNRRLPIGAALRCGRLRGPIDRPGIRSAVGRHECQHVPQEALSSLHRVPGAEEQDDPVRGPRVWLCGAGNLYACVGDGHELFDGFAA